MGNNNSGHCALSQAPPPWTQSLPRDAHRQKKYGAMQGTKVLPERIPGQRLKPTENGRNLQVQGTITTRRPSEMSPIPLGYTPSLSENHHSSMTALNHSPIRPLHLPPNQLPAGAFYPPHISDPMHKQRFGPPPSKSFTSEPDLRASPPTSHVSLPISNNIPHTVISESPTKGKIKSKKRNKAPPPPPVPIQASISLPIDYVPSPCMSPENWSSVSSPQPKQSKSKPKKIGLFKKKSESRMSNYEKESSVPLGSHSPIEEPLRDVNARNERATTPIPIQISSRKELKERAKSLDNLQHEIRRSPQGLTNSLHSLEVIGNEENGESWVNPPYEGKRRSLSPDPRRNSKLKDIHDLDIKETNDKRLSSTLDRESKGFKRMSTVERKLYEKQLEERRSEEILSSPVGDPRRFGIRHSRSSSAEHRRPSSSCSSCKDHYREEEVKDEWDLAEEEWNERKKKLESLQSEIISAAKNLRKTSTSPDHVAETAVTRDIKMEKDISELTVTSHVENEFHNEDSPKTFFFGMEPEESSKPSDSPNNKTALAKLNEQEEIKIIGTTVEYSRHSLKPKEKKRNLERDSWNRSLDYRDKSQSRGREREIEEKPSKSVVKKKLSREIDEFAATIERQKLKHKCSDEFSNSISRKGDGGYHSRQNSGSFHLEAEGSDEDNAIKMSLRPTLPRRQLELPRFSPNAAWRSLSLETTSRQKEVHSDITVNEDVFSVGEDQIHRYTRPVAPPRTSGEKSADSGISGDAGSPGPMQEFEPLTPEKIKASSGPLAVSSPVMSAKLDKKRAWTPAQDLDDNSFEEGVDQSGKGSLHQEVSTIPKLTSRTNMFSKPVIMNGHEEQKYKLNYDNRHKEMESSFSDKESPSKNHYPSKDYQMHSKSLQRVKEISPSLSNYKKDELEISNEDNWRENWSMSRSIPNSLNTCDEPDCVSDSSKPGRSRSESRMSVNNVPQPDNRRYSAGSKPLAPGYFPTNSGHIMYLPEYKSYHVNKKEYEQRILNHSSSKEGNKCPSSPEHERKSPSGDENPGEPENSRWNFEGGNAASPELLSKGNRFILLNGKKNKKFSYQSTVRMMEKKKLEEKLTKEVEEKEKRRLREVEAMMKVEQEFQKKREREKKRLKKQLQLFQQQQQQGINRTVDHNASNEENVFLDRSSPERQPVSRYDFAQHSQPGFPAGVPPFGSHRQMTNYQSLPIEIVNNNLLYEENHHNNSSNNQPNQSGLFSGIKKWVKSKKEPRSGYLSDASSATITSVSRQEPDGAPASSPGRKNHDNIRAEIIAASRHRNGTTFFGDGEVMTPNMLHRNKSPAPSVASKESHLRTATPDSRRAISPDSRKSLSSETCPLTRELPEMRQEHRQYREYRRSSRKQLMPPNIWPTKQNYKASPVTHNYRRDFCLGNISNSHMRVYPNDDSDRYSRHSNESRKSKQSSSKKSTSTDVIAESDFIVTDSLRRRYSSPQNMKSVPIPILPNPNTRNPIQEVNRPGGNRIPKAYQQSHITPYNPSKGYQPVSFSPSPGKILTVT